MRAAVRLDHTVLARRRRDDRPVAVETVKRTAFLLVLLGAGLAVARAERAPPPRGTLRLRNGDRLSGALEWLDIESGFAHIRAEYARSPVALQLDAIEEYRSPGTAAAEPRNWMIALANGDRLSGSLVALDERALTFDTPNAGPLSVSRSEIRTATHHIGGDFVFKGPGDERDWPSKTGSLKFEKGAVELGPRAHIGRTLERLPRRMRLEFDAAGNAAGRLTVQLYGTATAISGTAKPHYQLILASQNRLTLAHLSPQRGTRRFNTSAPQGDTSAEISARVILLADLDQHRFEAFVNGQSVAVWDDGERPTAAGTALTLMNLSTGTVTVSNLEVREWSGFLAVPPDAESGSTVLLKLNNGDVINGASLAISEGTVRIGTPFGNLTVPVERVANIAFPGPTVSDPPPPGAARVYLNDGTELTLVLQPAAAGEIVGVSAGLGRIRAPLDAVVRLEWEPRKPPPSDRSRP